MGVCNSCDRKNYHDAQKADNKAIDNKIKEIAQSSGSFRFPGERPATSSRFSEADRLHVISKANEPGARPQSGVFKIPNQFSPASPSVRSSKPEKLHVMDWGVCEVVNWWCEQLPDEAIQFAPLVEDTQLRGEDLLAMDLELLMSFQIDRPLAEHILTQIDVLIHESRSHQRNLTSSTATTTTNGDHVREYTMTSTGETQVFSDPEGDSVPFYWKSPGLVDETDDECTRIQSPVLMIMIDDDPSGRNLSEEGGLVNNNITPLNLYDPSSLGIADQSNNDVSPPRSPLSLLPPNSPRMNQEAEEDRIVQLEKQIQLLQDQLTHKHIQVFPSVQNGKKQNSRSNSGSTGKEKSARTVAKGRRKNGKNLKRKHGKFSVYKEGPTDIGRTENWSPARYDIEDDGRQFLDERVAKTNTDQSYHIYKEGPRDIGTISSGWKPYRHVREDSGRDFLAPRINRMKPVVRAPVRKEGPRGKTEVSRKRSSLIESGKRKSGSRKNSGKRKSSCGRSSRSSSRRSNDEKRSSSRSSRKNSGKRKSASRKNSGKRKSSAGRSSRSSSRRSNDEKRSSSRQRHAQDGHLSDSPQNFVSGDFRLLKMSFNCGGEDSSLCGSPRV